MLVNTSNYAAAPAGAALPDVRSPWTSLSVAVANHVRPQLHAALVMTESRLGAFRRTPAPAPMHQLAVVAAGLTTAVDIQKQNAKKQNVQKTRIGAGGYGAMGPHPEREPA